MTTNLKKFRMQTFKDVEVDSDSDPEDNTASSIKKRHKREIERAEQENRENTSALLELRDMEDELKTLQRLFDTQVNVIGKMLDIYMSENLKDLTRYGQAYLIEALGRLTEYKTQAVEMLERVAATRGDVSGPPSLFFIFFISYLPARVKTPDTESLKYYSTRNSLKWPSDKPKSTTCAGPASKQSWQAPRISRS